MFINLIFYIVELVEIVRNILFNKLFAGSRLFTIVRNEIDIIENQLKKLTFISLILGVAFLFFAVKFAFKVVCWTLNKLLQSNKTNASIITNKKDISLEDIGKLVYFQGFESIDLEFKDEGQDRKEVLDKFEKLKEEEEKLQVKKNFINGPIFTEDNSIKKVANEALKNNIYANLLHPDIFCGSRFIESELIRLSLGFFKGNDDCCGITTYGGTETLLLAMLAYRNIAALKGVIHPEMYNTLYFRLVPTTGHVGFNKACDSFGLKLIEVPLNINYEMDLDILRKKINKNTICIGASYPNNINGVCDNIPEIAKIASEHNIPFHVDAGLGGLLGCFNNTQNLPKCDFTVKGITSISIDYHRYGLSPQGISVLMYSDRVYRKNHYFIYNQWSGGIYPCSGFPGSRTPACVASALSLLLYLGKN